MRVLLAVLFHLAVAPLALASPPRISFERIRPAAHDLGRARDLAIVHAVGDTDVIDTFVEVFVDEVNHSGFLEARDSRFSTGPADAYLAVKRFSCETFNREGEGTVRDHDGKRIRRKQVWVDAVCSARVDVMGRDMKLVSSFYGRGEGASSRVDELSDDELGTAVQQAARYAAINAADRIMPKRVRDHIPLDESAPAFDEGWAMIENGRVRDARLHWEAALKQHPRSAALHANLAAVCEALGDLKSAEQHKKAARVLAASEK